MSKVRTRGAGTRAIVRSAPVATLASLHQLRLPTPWDVGDVQVYLIDGDPLTLIDTGVDTPESRAALEVGLDELGWAIDEIERVVVTHQHDDHVGQAQALRDAGARFELWAHDDEADDIELHSPERSARIDETARLFAEYGVPESVLNAQADALRESLVSEPQLNRPTRVEHRMRDGERIGFKDFDLEVIHAPGHTAGHVLLLERETGTLVTGDHIMGDAVPSTDNFYLEGYATASDAAAAGSKDSVRRERFRGLPLYLESLRRLRGESVETILPSHGGVIRHPRRAIEDASLFYEVRIQRIDRGLRKLAMMGQDVTGWEIWKALFPNDDPVRDMRTRMLMVIGALDVLEAKGTCVARRRADGVLEHHHV